MDVFGESEELALRKGCQKSRATILNTCSASHVLLELEILGVGNVLTILNLVVILTQAKAVEVDAN